MRRRHIPLALAVAALTACGSTVQTTAGSSTAVGPGGQVVAGGDGLGSQQDPSLDGAGALPGTAGATDASGSTGSTSGGTTAGAAPGTGAGPGTAGAPAGSAPGGGSAPGVAPQARIGRGITKTEIRIGIAVQDDAGAANRAAGLPSDDAGDPAGNYKLLVADLNKRGLIAGRKVVLRVFRFTVSGGATEQQIEQQACEFYTNDEPVFAVFAGGSENLNACLAKAGILNIGGGPTFLDTQALRRYPSLFLPGGLAVDRYARGLVDGLSRQGFFKDAKKVGILTFDDSIYRRVTTGVMIPMIKQQVPGDPVPAYVTKPQTVNQNSDYVAGIQSAMVRFRGEGVTHVLYLEEGSAMSYFGMQNAESQGYRPKHGLGSQSGFAYNEENATSDVKANQLPNVTGVGWSPFLDTTGAQFPALPGWERCKETYRKNGRTFDNMRASRFGAVACSEVWLLERALRVAGSELNLPRLTSILNSTGTDFSPTTTLGFRMTQAQHDAVTAYRNVRWNKDKQVFQYTSGNITF